ncbi:butyrophilin subfamily 2 member A2-like isoform X2 [Mastacembelus armatus]|uniref:butyrophilin subfamily 2 member A2-like isoform X2 n=1 Tax=Mastacembelus armatus TaxID=205130 RepID=UPI000E46433B|nr:butyrophilin subfamily 2 member A2-like isoform X2 [Mastacembelus armatus]
MELLAVVCLCLLTWSGTTFAAGNGPDVIKMVVKEGDDTILPCSLSTREDIVQKLFDWKRDGQKEVFLYDAGVTYGKDHPGQDEQFKQRVFHFPDQLQFGNASIVIRNTKVTDSGNYTCDFPRLQPRRRGLIELVVGATRKPYVTILEQTRDGVLLQCVVKGASPKPQLQWQDSGGNMVPAKDPQVTDRGGSYDIILQTTVTKTDHYRCVATQEEINHQVYAEIYVYISAPETPTGWIVGPVLGVLLVIVGVIVLLALVKKGWLTLTCNKGQSTSSPGPPTEGEPFKVHNI